MTTPRWYMVNKMGMATLCKNKKDAAKEARAMDMAWPHMGPHRAVQLVEAADVETLRTGYAAARLEIESLQARIKTMAEEHADELMVAHLDGRMRAAQPAGEYPTLPDAAGVVVEHVPVGGGWVRHERRQSYTADQMRAYADATCAMRAAQPAGAQQPAPSAAVASKAVLAAIRAANMQLVRTGDDEFMLVTLKQATPQAEPEVVEVPKECPHFGPSPARDAWMDGWHAARGRVIAAQPAGAQQPGVATWTPLPGTLPEPGKPVLLDIGMEYPIRAMWAAKHALEVGMEDDSGFGEYDEATDTYYCPEGWYEWNEHEEIHWAVNKTPTAWCELPPNGGASHGQAPAQAAPQGETNAQLDTDSNPPTPGQQRDVAGPVALGQPVGNGSYQAAGHTGAQGDKLLTVAERNIRSFLRSATFKSESDREAALNCVDVLWAAARAPADSVLEDAARLDWLALAGPTSICVVIDREHDGEVEVSTDDVTGYGKTLREALDKARKQGGA